jgi:phosphate transport system substrate-binding protein
MRPFHALVPALLATAGFLAADQDAGATDAAGPVRMVLRSEPSLSKVAAALISSFSSNHVGVVLDARSADMGPSAWSGKPETVALRHGRIPSGQVYQVLARKGFKPEEIRVGTDCILVAVQADNPIESISVEQLRSIYSGRIGNWKELGGEDFPIIAYGREAGSSTSRLFMELVLEGRYTFSRMQVSPGDRSVLSAVGRDKGGIGFGGLAVKGDGVKVLRIRTGDRDIAPDDTAIHGGVYPLSSPLYLVARAGHSDDPTPGEFAAWLQGEGGQNVLLESGQVPLPTYLRYR